MKTTQLVILIMTVALGLSACGELIPAPTITPVGVPASTATLDISTGSKSKPGSPIQETPISAYPIAVQKSVKDLSTRISIPVDQIQVVTYENVEWPDGCLGIQKLGVMCTEVIVPGYRVILNANGMAYEYHTNTSGSAVELNVGAGRKLENPLDNNRIKGMAGILIWHTSGGIAGLCKDLNIDQNGVATATSCTGGNTKILGQAKLLASELNQINTWVRQYSGFEFNSQDLAMADSISTRLFFNGTGTHAPPAAEQAALVKFAADLFERISSQK
jgi:hypothetical protein